MGAGAKHSNLTINELYDAPEFQGKNTLWGTKYFFLREEFSEARPNRFKNEVNKRQNRAGNLIRGFITLAYPRRSYIK